MATQLPFAGGPQPIGSGGSMVYTNNSPAGGIPYAYPYIRFQPSAVLANTNNVVDVVMPGGPAHPETWYVQLYTVAGGVLT